MATRTQKAAKKAKQEQAKAAKPARPAKEGKAAARKGAKGKGGKAARLRFEEEPLVELQAQPKELGFFDRLRARRAERAQQKAAERERKAQERAAEAQRHAEERAAAEVAAREAEEERERLRLAAEAEAEAARKVEEAKAKREAKKAERAEASRVAKEQEAAAAAEKERQEQEAAAAAEQAKQQRAAERQAKRAAMAAEEERLAREQAERDAAEDEARQHRENALKMAAKEEAERAKSARPAEPEPDMEFQEPSKPVAPGAALVPAGEAEEHADHVAAELKRRRSKPVVLEFEEEAAPPILKPAAPKTKVADDDQDEPDLPTPAELAARAAPPEQGLGISLPEAYLLLANDGAWDERKERNKVGAYGGALTGALLLELLMGKMVLVQRDRFTSTGNTTDDAALQAVDAALRQVNSKGEKPSLVAMGKLAKRNRDLLLPYKQRLADKGLIRFGSRRFLGLFYRSYVEVLNPDAQEKLSNRLRRAIAGGGTPDAGSILLLGLLDATGLFGLVVPDEAVDYNRKRLNGLLGGRDIMGYKVDPALKALQEVAVRTILTNVNIMTVRG